MAHVAITRCPDYDSERVDQAVQKAVDLVGGIDKYVKRGQKVLIKPNLLVASTPEQAICTHPEVVRAVIRLVQAAGAVVTVGDSPAFGSTEKVARRAGLVRVCQETGATLVSFDAATEVHHPAGRSCSRFPLAEQVTGADVVISLAKLKTHGLMYYTGAVKNLFGCLPGINKMQTHLRLQKRSDFAAYLVDLYTLIQPGLSLVDGIVSMEGQGPGNGTPRQTGFILAGGDALTVDMVGAAIIGLDPLELPVISVARQWGLVPATLNEVQISGSSLEEVKVDGFKLAAGGRQRRIKFPSAMTRWIQDKLTEKPVINRQACRGCGVCRDVCPPSSIRLKGQLAVIDEQQCIRCFCCQEICPHGAIGIRKSWLNRRLEVKS